MAPLWYRFAALPRQWPGRPRPSGWKPSPSRFKGHAWARAEREIRAELGHLRAKDVVFMLDLVGPGNIRDDGSLRGDARPVSSRVVLQFTRGDNGMRLTFPCDSYRSWEDNLWAIRVSLQALRAVDRHGVTQGDQQYIGFAALPPTGGSSGMTIERATKLLAELSGFEPDALAFPSVFASAVRVARSKAHPDAGGSTEKFQDLERAIELLGEQPT